MEEKKRSKKSIIIIGIIVIIIVVVGLIFLNIKNSVKNKQYIGAETTKAVNESKLSTEEKDLYKKTIARGNNTLLEGKSVDTIIQEERNRQTEEQRQLQEKRAKEEAEKQELANSINLNVYNRNITYKDSSKWIFSDFVELRMNCKNNTDKEIIALKG